jgi:hemolysin activation/secretion protein
MRFASLDSIRRGVAAVLILAGMPVLAQVPPAPNAGQILQQVKPPQEPPRPAPEGALPDAPRRPQVQPLHGDVHFKLESVSFKGNTVFTDAQLTDAVRDHLKKNVGPAQLQAITEAVVQRYLRSGYFLAQALYEPQDVTAGNLQVSILEGRLGRVRIEKAPDAPIPDRLIEGLTRSVLPGRPINQRDLERAMLMLSDQPGIVATSSLEAGTEPGSTDLVIEIIEGRRLRLALDADNYGTYSTGDWRAGASLRWASPLGIGDALDIRPVFSQYGGILFGRVGYELPVGNGGARLAAGVSRLEYELQRELSNLGGEGEATTVDLSLAYPLIRSRSQNLFLQAGMSGKWLEDRYRAVGAASDRRIAAGSLGFTYERRDRLLGGGYSSVNLTGHAGSVDFYTDVDPTLRLDRLDTEGSYTKLTASLARLQAVRGPITAFAGIAGQLAGSNLDNAERLSLGGPYAVRAYPPSELVVDQGAVATLELRWSLRAEITAFVFYDYGWGEISRDPVVARGNSVCLGGGGIGASWIRPGNFSLRASLGWPTSGEALSDPRDRDPRLYVQAVKLF